MIATPRLPHVSAYLGSLPAGLDSYPQCRMRTDFAKDTLREYPELLQRREVPQPLGEAIAAGIQGDAWHPVVHAMTYQKIVVDLIFGGDEAAHLRHGLDNCIALFGRPLYRALFFVMSPNLLILGAHNRWNTFCRGVAFETLAGDKHSHRGRLIYPDYLCDDFSCNVIGVGLRAAMAAAGAKAVTLLVNQTSPCETELSMRWL